MILSLNHPRDSVTLSYSIVSMTGPIFGTLCGGIVTQKLGGYDNVKIKKFLPMIALIVNICIVDTPIWYVHAFC